jgi:hypothetical protein
VPEPWLTGEPGFAGPRAVREAYVAHLMARVAAPRAWLPKAAAS